MKRNNKGFTLIELLVVIAIIGLLATLAVVALNSARQKSRDAKRISDIKQIQTALELFYNDENGYPDGTSAGEEMTAGTDLAGTSETYMAVIPTAPTPLDGDCTSAENTYTYTQTGSGSGYTLTFCLGAPTGGLGLTLTTPVCTATQTGITCVEGS